MLIYGAGGQARVIIEILKSRKIRIEGLIDCNIHKHGQSICGVPILGGDERLYGLLQQGITDIIVAIGDNRLRQKKALELKKRGFIFGQAIHPSANIAKNAVIGKNVVIAIGAIVGANAVVGDHVIVNSGAIVEHDNKIGAAVHLSPGVTLGGTVVVGERTWIGIGSTVINNLIIGQDSIIAAGSVVIKPVPDKVMVAGVPAKVKKVL